MIRTMSCEERQEVRTKEEIVSEEASKNAIESHLFGSEADSLRAKYASLTLPKVDFKSNRSAPLPIQPRTQTLERRSHVRRLRI
jgi:hypothetical protein